MRKHLVLAAAVGLLTVLTVPSALATVTPANGNDVVLPDGSVYQGNADGSYSQIPDVATGDAMGLNWSALTPVDAVPGPVSDPFPSVLTAEPGVTPANGNDVVLPDGSVYQGNADGSYSWIPNAATANAMGIDWSSLQPVDTLPGPLGAPFPSVVGLANASLNPLASGAAKSPAPSSATNVTPANGNDVVLPYGSVYQGNADGSYSWIPDVATGDAMGIDWNALIPVDALPGPVGTPFPHAA
jgi:hypothetical protein